MRKQQVNEKIIDFNDTKVIKQMNDCMEAQQKCLDRKKIDYVALHKLITI